MPPSPPSVIPLLWAPPQDMVKPTQAWIKALLFPSFSHASISTQYLPAGYWVPGRLGYRDEGGRDIAALHDPSEPQSLFLKNGHTTYFIGTSREGNDEMQKKLVSFFSAWVMWAQVSLLPLDRRFLKMWPNLALDFLFKIILHQKNARRCSRSWPGILPSWVGERGRWGFTWQSIS